MPRVLRRNSAESWSSLSLGEDVPGDDDLARSRPLEPGQQHQQRGLAAAGGPDNGDDFGRLDASKPTFLRMWRGWPAILSV